MYRRRMGGLATIRTPENHLILALDRLQRNRKRWLVSRFNPIRLGSGCFQEGFENLHSRFRKAAGGA